MKYDKINIELIISLGGFTPIWTLFPMLF